MLHAVDTSHVAYGNRAIPWSTWESFKADGWDMLILGLHGGRDENTHAEETLRNARQAGLLTAGYVVIRPHMAGSLVARSREVAGSEWQHLAFVAVDVEWGKVDLRQDLVHTADIAEAVERIRQLDQQPIIYTYHYYWGVGLGDITHFSHLPLWDADYPGEGIAGTATFTLEQPYGGWQKRTIHQYQDTHMRWGLPVDANIVDAQALGIMKEGEEMELTPEQTEALMLMQGIGWEGRERQELEALINREAHYREVVIPDLRKKLEEIAKEIEYLVEIVLALQKRLARSD